MHELGALTQELFDALMQDALVKHVKLAELANELDVAQHLALGLRILLLLLRAECTAIFLERCNIANNTACSYPL